MAQRNNAADAKDKPQRAWGHSPYSRPPSPTEWTVAGQGNNRLIPNGNAVGQRNYSCLSIPLINSKERTCRSTDAFIFFP